MAPVPGHGLDVAAAESPTERFQVLLAGNWRDVEVEEDLALKAAVAEGEHSVVLDIRGFSYECDLTALQQRNLMTGKVRQLRPPAGLRFASQPDDISCLDQSDVVLTETTSTTAGTEDTLPSSSGRSTQTGSSLLSKFRGAAKSVKIKAPFSLSCAAKTAGAAGTAAAVLTTAGALADEFLMDGQMGVADGLLDAAGEAEDFGGDCVHGLEGFVSDAF
eukprot:TRINITY_DN10227_c0_g1_i1.p1 TRINITY_DN10227_c0_g1~~TRINITY_DN10227_c0_g1_i1.p1  ORF type:complete len:218 (+),score=55.83 TRINITY_DN10227_c0_g1_i1:68-721(+)